MSLYLRTLFEASPNRNLKKKKGTHARVIRSLQLSILFCMLVPEAARVCQSGKSLPRFQTVALPAMGKTGTSFPIWGAYSGCDLRACDNYVCTLALYFVIRYRAAPETQPQRPFERRFAESHHVCFVTFAAWLILCSSHPLSNGTEGSTLLQILSG